MILIISVHEMLIITNVQHTNRRELNEELLITILAHRYVKRNRSTNRK